MKTEVVKVFLQKRLADKDIYYVNYTLITDNDFIVCNQQSIDEIIQKYYELKEKYKKQSLLLNKIKNSSMLNSRRSTSSTKSSI